MPQPKTTRRRKGHARDDYKPLYAPDPPSKFFKGQRAFNAVNKDLLWQLHCVGEARALGVSNRVEFRGGRLVTTRTAREERARGDSNNPQPVGYSSRTSKSKKLVRRVNALASQLAEQRRYRKALQEAVNLLESKKREKRHRNAKEKNYQESLKRLPLWAGGKMALTARHGTTISRDPRIPARAGELGYKPAKVTAGAHINTKRRERIKAKKRAKEAEVLHRKRIFNARRKGDQISPIKRRGSNSKELLARQQRAESKLANTGKNTYTNGEISFVLDPNGLVVSTGRKRVVALLTEDGSTIPLSNRIGENRLKQKINVPQLKNFASAVSSSGNGKEGKKKIEVKTSSTERSIPSIMSFRSRTNSGYVKRVGKKSIMPRSQLTRRALEHKRIFKSRKSKRDSLSTPTARRMRR
eukprot:g1085.t1